MQIVSETFLSLGLESLSDISEAQLILLDISADEKTSWFDLALGKNISDARAELFVLLKGISNKADQDKIIENYKALQTFRKTGPDPKTKKDEPMKRTQGDVVIYCDGGCSPNPGESGSGIAIYRNGKVSELWYGLYESMGTNNTAELNALYQSLLLAQKENEQGNKVEIKCDSMYSINCIKTWAKGWEKNGWTKKGGEIKNLEIIQKSYSLYNQLKVSVELSHIKAHCGLEGNELADRMTVHAREVKKAAFLPYEDTIDVEAILQMRAD
ncbi:MAG: ribonuclease H family protein [Thiovulaceae bacterium]|nr:ribonuclease H family protein [Sulfurimonadaceae bacterium]